MPSEEKSVKITLNVFSPTPAASPLPPAPTPPAPPPPAPTPPEPIVKPEPPKPVEKPKPTPKPAERVVKKIKPNPTPKPVKEPEPEIAEAPTPTQITPSESKTSDNRPSSAVSSNAKSDLPPSGAETVGEFNFATSAGDERFSKIQKAIQKHHKYPKRAQKMRHQGVVEVSFLYKKDGTVRDVKVIKSSGFETLDEAAVELINRAAPDFPTLDRDYVIKIPVSYKLT